MERSLIDLDLLRKILPEWNSANNTNIKIKALSLFDPESAALFKVRFLDSPLQITYRRFNNEECFQKYIFAEQYGIGPKVFYAKYPLMIQEFIADAKAPGLDGILKPKVYNSMLRELAKYHKIKPSDEFNRKSFFAPYLKMQTEDQSPTLLSEFSQICKNAQDQDGLEEKDKLSFKKLQGILEETEFISKLIKPLRLFWCHCDLHESNLLWDPVNNKITLLDYEDSAYNFRGYDLANALLETEWDLMEEDPKYRRLEAKYGQIEEERYLLIYTLHWIDPIWEKNPTRAGIELETLTREDIKVLIINQQEQKLFWESFEEVRREYLIGRVCASYHWVIWNALHFRKNPEDWVHLAIACMKLNVYYECKKVLLDAYRV